MNDRPLTGKVRRLQPRRGQHGSNACGQMLTILEAYDSESDAIASFGPSGPEPST